MSIGAISAYGAINALSFRPYVYNTNTLSSASMNKLSRISDDVLDKKIDYSELADESFNENPLKKGQTLDFQGILDMQMRRGQSNAARIMKPMDGAAESVAERGTARAMPNVNADTVTARAEEEDTRKKNAAQVNADESVNTNDGNNINYQMQQALRAYEMFMTA